ncbi:hypothetical protein ACH518_09650 [Methylomonas sp. HW2-6]|uniref:hypothetical protein n=1 Tax=Methylomonas sp. HW2-6 TaxID=3376687 RepID=UPI004042B745
MIGRQARIATQYDDLAAFVADGGASNYGDGPVGIGNQSFRCHQRFLLPVSHGVAEKAAGFDVINGSGVLNNKVTDSGHTWSLSGTGVNNAIIADDHVESTANTYLYINTGQPVRRIIQRSSGHGATLAFLLTHASLADMIHVNFVSGGARRISHWKTGTGSDIDPIWSIPYGSMPAFGDGNIHEFMAEIIDGVVFGYIDKQLVIVAYHPDYKTVSGNSIMLQLHDAGTGNAFVDDKIYEFAAYTHTQFDDALLPNPVANCIRTKALLSYQFQLGNPSGAGFSPQSRSYFWTDDANGHFFSGSSIATVRIKSQAAGYAANLIVEANIGSASRVEITAGNDAVGKIRHGGVDKITFPNGITRADFAGRVRVAALPTSAAGLSSGELWNNGGTLAIVP